MTWGTFTPAHIITLVAAVAMIAAESRVQYMMNLFFLDGFSLLIISITASLIM